MGPTARRHRAAADRGRAQVAAEPAGHGRLTSPGGGSEPANPEVLPGRRPQPRVRPGALAQGVPSGTARQQEVQPGRLARGVTGGIAWLQRVQPGRLARGIADRTARLQPGRLVRGIADRTARLQPGRLARGIADRTARLQPSRLARRIRSRVARLQWVQSGELARVIAVGTSRFQGVHLRLPGRDGTARVRAGRLAHGITRGAEGFWRRHPWEAIAIILLALAAVAYPVPFWWLDFVVWLTGAAIAASSRLWDLRDKWVGLVGPIAVVIIGTSVALTLGGTRSSMAGYVHEMLAESLYMIKLGSLAGAGYLVWRIYQGRRIPRVPPWQRRHR